MPTKENEAAIDAFKRALGLLNRHMRATATPEQQDLSSMQKSVIVRLEDEGPMTSADLARAEGVKPQSMSTAVAQLEQRGLVEKKARKDDGRQIDIRVTVKSVAMRKASREASRSWLSQRMTILSRAEQEALLATTQIIEKLVKS